ncbi:MAG: efflux RND transporter permease subunit [Chloroherpetonaceae bacterium]|nr:efflux RND transporter permease subunit [Chloroherpetonaceae bacterium]
MTITELSIRRPSLIIVVFILLGSIGLFSYSLMKYELLPKIDTPSVTVTTVYPGASPSDVESSVTKKIEDALSTLDRVKRITSTSAEGYSVTYVEFELTVNEDLALAAAQRKVNEILSTLPEKAKTPTLSKFSLSDLPVMRLSATSNLPMSEFYKLLKERIRPALSQLEGVGNVTLVGGSEREVQVKLDAKKLEDFGLTALSISEAISQTNYNLPAGKVKAKDQEISLRVNGKFLSLDEIKNKTIVNLPNGSKVKISDVAEVTLGLKDQETFSRLNSNESIALLIQKQSGANSVEISRLVREEIKKLRDTYSAEELQFDIASDGSEFTLAAADAVTHDLLVAIILVAAVMLLFLHSLRSAVIVMISIPASLISTFIFMSLFGFSLNLMTLLAMSLVIGILVDDSIVVLENIFRHLEMEKTPFRAALEGRNEIGFSAISITLVDVVVFLPLSFVPGIAGNIIREFALVVVFSTLMSLFVCFTLTPMLASRFSKLTHLNSSSVFGRIIIRFEKMIESLSKIYLSVLKWALSHRKTILVGSVASLVFAISLIPLGFIGGEFVTPMDRGELSVVMELPVGTKLEETNDFAKSIEQKLKEFPEVKKIFSTVGSSNEAFLGESASNVIEMFVQLVPKGERKRNSDQVSEALKTMITNYPGVKARISPIGLFGTGDGYPIMINLSNASRDSLLKSVSLVAGSLQSISGISDVRLSFAGSKSEIEFRIDDEKLTENGLSLAEVSYALRVAFAGDEESKFTLNETEMPIRISYRDEEKKSTDFLSSLVIQNQSGVKVPILSVASIRTIDSPSKLERKNRMPSITIFAKPFGRSTGEIGEDFNNALRNIPLTQGTRISLEGDLEMQGDSFGKLGLAFLAAILFIYLVMVALYDSFIYPLIVLFSIPVAITGALIALAVTGSVLDIFSILGLIMLTGLVGKNAILLVDRTIQNRKGGMTLYDSLLEAGETRLRPILMTTVAMVIGMLPVALSSGGGSEWKNGLGWALIGGLSSSMFLTLLLVPTIFIDIENLVAKLKSWISKSGVLKFIEMNPIDPEFTKAVNQEELSKNEIQFSNSNEIMNEKHLSHRNNASNQIMKSVVLMFILTALTMSIKELQAQEFVSKPLNFETVKSLARKENVAIKMARLQELKTKAQVRTAIGNALPSLNASLNYTYNIRPQVFFLPNLGINPTTGEFGPIGGVSPIEASLPNSYVGNMSLELPLLNYETWIGIKASSLLESLAKTEREGQEIAVVTEARKTYVSILFLHSEKRLIESSIQRAEDIHRENQRLYNAGLISETDTLRSYVSIQSLRPESERIAHQEIRLHSYLKLLLNLPGSVQLKIEDSLEILYEMQRNKFQPSLQTLDTLILQALNQRSDKKSIAIQKEVAEATVDREIGALMPKLSLIGAVQIQAQSNRFSGLPIQGSDAPVNSFVGLQFSLPIFTANSLGGQIEAAEIDRKTKEEELRQIEKEIHVQVENAVLARREAESRVSSIASTKVLAERNFQLVKSRYSKGLAKQLDVTDAEFSLKESSSRYLASLVDFILASIELEKALGFNFEEINDEH